MPPTNDVPAFGSHAPRGVLAIVLKLTRLRPLGWLGRRLGFAGRTIGIKMLRGRPLDVSSLGIRMRLYPAHNQSEKNLLFTPHLFDPDEREILAGRIGDNFVFVDIGANVGGYALFVAALAGPSARVLAIEPQPEIFERLVFNIGLNPFGTVKALECAVTDRDGTVTLFVDPSNSGQSSVRFVNSLQRSVAVKVTAKTLKTVVAEEQLTRIDAMKVDVEGAEELILEPFFRHVAPEPVADPSDPRRPDRPCAARGAGPGRPRRLPAYRQDPQQQHLREADRRLVGLSETNGDERRSRGRDGLGAGDRR